MFNNLKWSAGNLILDRVLKYIDKDPRGNLSKLILKAAKIGGKVYPEENFIKAGRIVKDENNVWSRFALNLLSDIDREYLKKFFLSFAIGTGMGGTKTSRESREKYKCNIPWIILMDPTSACNKNCKGCWSAEYGHRLNLSFDEMNGVINQAVSLGTHFYMFTGGEPLIRKDDIIKLCEEHRD